MHKNPLCLPVQQRPRPVTNAPVWEQLPIPHRCQCHELITQLLLSVIHSECSEEYSHERQD